MQRDVVHGITRDDQDRQLTYQCGGAQNNREIDRQWFEYDSGATVFRTIENIDLSTVEPVSLYVSFATSILAPLGAQVLRG